jgi:hypothetical protein
MENLQEEFFGGAAEAGATTEAAGEAGEAENEAEGVGARLSFI